jgi:hypothetical protein
MITSVPTYRGSNQDVAGGRWQQLARRRADNWNEYAGSYTHEGDKLMQSAMPEGRSLVPASSSVAVDINPAAKAPGQAARAANTRAAVDIGKVLDEISESLQSLVGLSPQHTATSQGRSLFATQTSSPMDTLAPIRSTLDGISQKLSAAVTGSQAPADQPSQVDQDWPYPDLGPNPFMSAPTGSGPGSSFAFNPTYFPTESTADTIAQMLGGKVVAQNAMLTAPGSPFAQNQPNYMIELPNGNVFNPGFIAQAIAAKQPRATIDAMIYSEVNNTPVAIGQAPPFVPVNATSSGDASAAAGTSSSGWSSVDQLATHLYAAPGSGAAADDSAGSVRDRIQSTVKMLQVLSQMASIRRPVQSEAAGTSWISK